MRNHFTFCAPSHLSTFHAAHIYEVLGQILRRLLADMTDGFCGFIQSPQVTAGTTTVPYEMLATDNFRSTFRFIQRYKTAVVETSLN
jgi:hypothetical protein